MRGFVVLTALLFTLAAEASLDRGVRGVRGLVKRQTKEKDGEKDDYYYTSKEQYSSYELEAEFEDMALAKEAEKEGENDPEKDATEDVIESAVEETSEPTEEPTEETLEPTEEPTEPVQESGGEPSEPLDKVNISIQPAYHGIPVYLGVQFGLFRALGLDVNITVWESGGPQVAAAVEEDAWDFGVAGSVQNIIAASEGISTVGISNDESSANQVVGGPGVQEFPPSGELSEGVFVVSPGTTTELVMRRCLEAFEVSYNESNFQYGTPDDVVDALETGNSSYGALWAPNSYVYLSDNEGSQEFCNGQVAGITIPGGLMIRDDWGKENPDLAAKTLAVYLHGVTLMQNLAIRDRILEHARGFYEYAGLEPTDAAIERDFLTRPMFNLDAQLGLMSRNSVNYGLASLDHIYADLSAFLVDEGIIDEAPAPQSYLTDEYLQMISNDPDLRFFANAGYTASAMEQTSNVAIDKAGPDGRKKA